MRLEDRDAGILWKMRETARDAMEVARELTLKKLQHELIAQLAIAKALERIGEAALGVSREFRDAHPEIPWSKIIGMRHRLVHDYDGTEFDILWKTLQEEVPILISQLDRLLPPVEEEKDVDST